MNSTHIISQDVFDKIRSRFTNLEMGNEAGDTTSDPKEARFFDFDFVVEGNNLGRVSISINETGALKLFYSQGILESTDDFVHQLWYDFLREMRMFAKRRLLRFDTRDITKSNLNKDDFQYLANTGSKDNNMSMNESAKFQGGPMTSKRVLEKAVLIAKHHHPIHDESFGARSRKNNIKALFIENEDGERYKFPFIYIAGAKAMQRHVANGGRPYDEVGQNIIKMCEHIAQLTAFKRHVGNHDGMNQEVNEIVERSNAKLIALRRQIESICGQAGYEQWANQAGTMSAVGSDGLELDQATMENYKSAFTVSSFREDLAQYFPLIHSIMQETSTVELEDYVGEGAEEEYCDACDRPVEDCVCDKTDEGAFENFMKWADRVAEGKLEPDTIMDLKDLLDSGLTLDVDGESAINALQGIGVHDDELENQLRLLADPEQGGDPKNDPKPTILKWLSGEDPEAAQELGHDGAEDEDSMNGDDDQQDMDQEVSPKAVAEMVFSMYNRNHKEQGLGPFPRGEEGVITHVTKELGDRAGKMAEMLVNYLANGQHEMNESQLDEIKKGQKDSNGYTKCWPGKHAEGTKKGEDGGQVRNCVPNEDIEEGIGDEMQQEPGNQTSSYQVARYMFDKGIRYTPEEEKHVIGQMDNAMMKLGMSHKTIRYLLSYDEDFIPDTLSYLQHMEGAVDEVSSMEGVAGAALGGVAGAGLTKSARGAMVGAELGSKAQDVLSKEGADMDKIPAYIRKQKQQSQEKAQQATDKRNQDSGAKVWKSARTNEELARIAQLAGLAK